MIERHTRGTMAPAPLSLRSRPGQRDGSCGSPGCSELGGHGVTGRFCAEHAGELARVRERMSAQGTFRQRSDQRKRGPRSATCCALGCLNVRIPPAAFCDDCIRAGFVEEENA